MITDELREYALGWDERNRVRRELTAIADRIDAEHERKIGCTDDEWDYWESTHIELPKEADGEYIYVGEKLDGYGKTIEVVELRYGRSGWVLISRDGNAYADTFAFTHHHAPTVEDVLREFAKKVCEGDHIVKDGRYLGIEDVDLLAEYAAKLQLRESE